MTGNDHTDLAITAIRTDGGTQMRAGLNKETVEEYADFIYQQDHTVKWPFPPVEVYYDGESYWLADGFHRLAALRKVMRWPEDNTDVVFAVPAIVHAGDRRAAVLHAAGANAAHGLRRSNADKRRAVETLLRDEEWGQWSDREIARRCHVSAPLVAQVRSEIHTVNSYSMDGNTPTERTFVHPKSGQPTTMNVSGQRQAANAQRKFDPPAPTLTADQIVLGRLVRAGWGFLKSAADGQHYAFPPGKSGRIGPFATGDEAIAAAQSYMPAPEAGDLAVGELHAHERQSERPPRKDARVRNIDIDRDVPGAREYGCRIREMDWGNGEITYNVEFPLSRGMSSCAIEHFTTRAEAVEWVRQKLETAIEREAGVYDYGKGDDDPPPPTLPADLMAQGCKLTVRDGWFFVEFARHASTCDSLEQAVALCRRWTGTTEPTASAGAGCEAHQKRQASIRTELEFWREAYRRSYRVGELTGQWTGAASALSRSIEEVMRLYGKELDVERSK
jgi:hypothetical protein